MDNVPKATLQQTTVSATQHEDAILKTMMHFFADELLPYFGIHEKVVSIAPTELVQLEIKKLFQDFNLVMEDGSWKHFEFQSTNEGIEGLKRFRSYEALASYQHHVSVTTYVLFSGKITDPVTEFTEGINTYRIIPIIMREMNADEFLRKLKEQIQYGTPVTREDLVVLTLCPLMGGTSSQKDRILAAFAITKEATEIEPDELRKIEAVIYAMADKFLDSIDIEEVMEEISMTRIGQKLIDEGISRGISEGITEGTEQTKLADARNLVDILDVSIIAERIGLPLETVQKIKDEYLASKK